MVMSTGEAVSVGVSVGVKVATSVWVALTGRAVVVAVPNGVCVGELNSICTLQAERTTNSASDIDKKFSVFNFASMNAIEMATGVRSLQIVPVRETSDSPTSGDVRLR